MTGKLESGRLRPNRSPVKVQRADNGLVVFQKRNCAPSEALVTGFSLGFLSWNASTQTQLGVGHGRSFSSNHKMLAIIRHSNLRFSAWLDLHTGNGVSRAQFDLPVS